jgi:predicted PurR-regulated permease PerM
MAMTQAVTLLHSYGGSLTDADGKDAAWIEQLQHSLGDFVERGAQWLLNSAGSLASRGSALLDFASLLVVTPVVAFYMLVDWDRMTATLDSWLPREHRQTLRRVGGEINQALAGFIRGQLLVCLSLAVYYAIGLTLIRLNFGFLIGVAGGALAFIPYVGSMTVMVFSLGIGLVQGWPSWTLFLEAFAVVAVGQFLEAYVISPKLVGESVGLHPVWLMFALFAGGALFGFVGLMLAVPAAAAIGVLFRHLLSVYFASPLYLGGEGATAKPTAE